MFSHRPCYKGQKHTLIGAISVKCIVCLRMIQGSMKGEDFLAFIKNYLVLNLSSEDRIIIDNLSCHKVNGIEQSIIQTGAKVLYLPTYSFDFNLIEMLWSVIKYFIGFLGANSQKMLQHLINIFPLLVEKSFFKNWFTKCCCCAA